MTNVVVHVVGGAEPIELAVESIHVTLKDVRGLTGLVEHDFTTTEGQPVADSDVVKDGDEVVAARGVRNG
jgi:hypothetical protein